MTAKEAILSAMEGLPDECLEKLARHIEQLRQHVALQQAPTALASEASLAKDWLRPEEDEAWRDL